MSRRISLTTSSPCAPFSDIVSAGLSSHFRSSTESAGRSGVKDRALRLVSSANGPHQTSYRDLLRITTTNPRLVSCSATVDDSNHVRYAQHRPDIPKHRGWQDPRIVLRLIFLSETIDTELLIGTHGVDLVVGCEAGVLYCGVVVQNLDDGVVFVGVGGVEEGD